MTPLKHPHSVVTIAGRACAFKLMTSLKRLSENLTA